MHDAGQRWRWRGSGGATSTARQSRVAAAVGSISSNEKVWCRIQRLNHQRRCQRRRRTTAVREEEEERSRRRWATVLGGNSARGSGCQRPLLVLKAMPVRQRHVGRQRG